MTSVHARLSGKERLAAAVGSALLAVALLATGLFACCLPITTEMLAPWSEDASDSPYTAEQLQRLARAARDYTVDLRPEGGQAALAKLDAVQAAEALAASEDPAKRDQWTLRAREAAALHNGGAGNSQGEREGAEGAATGQDQGAASEDPAKRDQWTLRAREAAALHNGGAGNSQGEREGAEGAATGQDQGADAAASGSEGATTAAAASRALATVSDRYALDADAISHLDDCNRLITAAALPLGLCAAGAVALGLALGLRGHRRALGWMLAAISHLDDCNRLITAAALPLGLCAAGAVALGLALGLRGHRRALGWMLALGPAVMAAVLAALALWAAVDFMGFFRAFHGLFFPQGNWTFAIDSLLITMYPTNFWMGMGAVWAVTTLVLSILCLGFGIRLARRRPHTNESD